MRAKFDLIYVCSRSTEKRTMSVGVIRDDGSTTQLGPFSGTSMGRDLTDAMLAADMGFADRGEAEMAYMINHLKNMMRGQNGAGQSYPYMVP